MKEGKRGKAKKTKLYPLFLFLLKTEHVIKNTLTEINEGLIPRLTFY